MSEDNATDTQEAEERPLIGAGMNIQALLSIPATAAIGIGVVYALGALARSVELAHAGISVRDAFPLIPVEQHLGRGIQLLVQPVVLVVILILVVMIGLALYDRERPKRPVKPITKRRRVAVNAASAVAILASAFFAPIVSLAAVIGVAIGGVLVVGAAAPGQRKDLRRARLSPGLAVLLAIVTLGSSVLAIEVMNPEPLSTVSLQTTDDGVVNGPLATFADGTWYFGGAHHQLIAVDAREVRSAVITPGHRRHDTTLENLFQLVFG